MICGKIIQKKTSIENDIDLKFCFCVSVNYVGIIPPSDGKAEIFGYDLSSQIDLVRPSIGFCPQTSILYDQLTVYEHLYILATVKDQSS